MMDRATDVTGGTRDTDLERIAHAALQRLQAAGFEQAHAAVRLVTRDELNIAHNEPSLMRSTEQRTLALAGIEGGRRASTETGELEGPGLEAAIADLRRSAAAAPVDDAWTVSSRQQARITQGPREGDRDALARAARRLLAFRAEEAPPMVIDECYIAHRRVRSHTATSGGSALGSDVGWYEASVFGTAKEGRATSSFNVAGGQANALDTPIEALFGIGEMLRSTVRQLRTQRPADVFGGGFEGEVVLHPNAVQDLVEWLLGQLGDLPLIAGTSLYARRVGEPVGAACLTLQSRFDAPGSWAASADGCVAPPVTVLRDGRLETLLPSLYASRKTGLPHVPVAEAGGWAMAPGDRSVEALVAAVPRGALVGRLSMGRPASNGDFSGVAKNSFAVVDGEIGPALAETMISGNVARMLAEVRAASRERLDTGSWLLPWLAVPGLHFS